MRATKDLTNGRWKLDGIKEDDQTTYQTILSNLKEGVKFKFARYGDGELNCMSGRIGSNCDKHQYFPDMGMRLCATVARKNNYMVGIQPLSVAHKSKLVDEFILKNYYPQELYNADVLHNASIDGKFDTFLDVLSRKYLILVGPTHLAGLFAEMVHIVVPDVNAWLMYDKIKEQLAEHLSGTTDSVVLLSCGMMAEVMIYDFKDENCTIIDTGSVFDPYVGVKSRSYHFLL
jgi:hypothetical protein